MALANKAELVAEQLAQANLNKKIWGTIFYNVKLFGAKGDGITDDSAAVVQALNAARITGGQVNFPPGTYKLDIPIQIMLSNVEIVGLGATIDCRGTRDIPGVNGIGGGMTIQGDQNTVTGISFVGYQTVQGSIDYGYGDLLHLQGNLNKVTECNFKDGNSGAVYLNGNKNLVTKCNFDGCNNHGADGADFGAVNIIGGYGNVVKSNWIENHFYSGIAIFGDVYKTKILDNFIKSLSPLGMDTSMGIYVFNGAGRDLDIIDNTIEGATAEAICVFSSVAVPTKGVKIADNRLRDYGSNAIAIYKGDGGVSTGVKIRDNECEAGTKSPGYHIFTEMLKGSRIKGNTINGRETGVGTIGTGIYVGSSPSNNVVADNDIFNVNKGIEFADLGGGGKVCDNTLVMCSTGINYFNCGRVLISSNNIVDCTTDFLKGINGDYALLLGNRVSGQTTSAMVPMLYGDVQTTVGGTVPIATGTLAAGTATITYYNIDAGDVFMVLPFTSQAQANSGDLYIVDQNASTDQLVIKSTNAADTRKFAVIKVARGVS